MGAKKVRSDIGQGKRIIVRTVVVKKEIITEHEKGVHVSDLAAEYNMAKSPISTIITNKEVMRGGGDVAKGITVISKQRPPIL